MYLQLTKRTSVIFLVILLATIFASYTGYFYDQSVKGANNKLTPQTLHDINHVAGENGTISSLQNTLSTESAQKPQLQGGSMRPGISGFISITDPRLLCRSFSLDPPVKSDTVELVARSKSGGETVIPVWETGGYNCVSMDGFFMAKLHPGSYSLTLSYCNQTPPGPGCASLPKTVNVENGGFTEVTLNILLESSSMPPYFSWNVTITISPPTGHSTIILT